MARKRVRTRKRLGALIVGGLVLAAGTAYATYPVIDAASIAKLSEQLNQAAKDFANQLEQLEQLKQSVGFLNELQSAVGSAANITVPITSSENMAGQLRSNLRCLMPKGTGWGIDTEEVDFGSICNGSRTYGKAFFISGEREEDGSGSGPLSYEELDARRREVDRRRHAFLADTTVRSLAMSDVQLKQAEETTKAAQELKTAADAAVTERTPRRAAHIQVTQLAARRNRREILAQMLKLHTAMGAERRADERGNRKSRGVRGQRWPDRILRPRYSAGLLLAIWSPPSASWLGLGLIASVAIRGRRSS